jgi:response regulator RpfG family c-di-GMP phosphodiesterase
MNFKEVYQYTKDLNVLYAEDDVDLSEETSEIFEDFFATVEVAYDGQEALEKYNKYFEDNGKYYDLIITDINMPRMNGKELLKNVNEINNNQSSVVISAYNNSSLIIELVQNGISNFALKPIESEQLMEVLYRTCRNVVAHKELERHEKELEETNDNLEHTIEDQVKEIAQTQKISIEAIANMVERYHEETGAHVKRIECYATKLMAYLPKELLSDYHFSDQIPMASVLHDIGKIVVSKEILLKPGKHTEDEHKMMQKHTSFGGELLLEANDTFKKEFGKDSYLIVAGEIAYYHHEKYDGTGYPKGLKGADIPLGARIIAVADVYDALRSKRVYKDGWSHAQTVEQLQKETGTAFDPVVIEAFMKAEKEIEIVFDELQ